MEVYYSKIDWDNICVRIGESYHIKIMKSYVQISKNELLKMLIEFMIADLSYIVIDYLVTELDFVMETKIRTIPNRLNCSLTYYLFHNIEINNERIQRMYQYYCISNYVSFTDDNEILENDKDYIYISNEFIQNILKIEVQHNNFYGYIQYKN